MRAAHNNAHNREGQSGAGFLLPHLPIVHVVERRVGRAKRDNGQWVDVWTAEGKPFENSQLACRSADVLRARGFVVRVRPYVL